VTAFDTAQKSSAPSGPATATTPAAPADGPPTVPGKVAATPRSATEVVVSWTASTDTDGTGVAGYTITRDGSPFATVNAPATTFTDTSASPSTTYHYTVAAFDTAQNSSAPSLPATVTTPSGMAVTDADDLWHLDETSGTTMADSGQTPHPGTLHDVTLGQEGDPSFPGTSYGFNGGSSFVSIPDAPDLNADNKDVRIALSLRTTTVPAQPDYDLFRKGQAPGTEYKLELMPAGEFRCEFRTLQADGSIRSYVIQPAIDLHDGHWHRLTCDKVGGKMTATIDGTAFTKNITGSISNNYDMMIGAYSPKGGGDYYEGLLDEISFRTGG
jgi:Concanavalin A-like lectin/glucanases superfamily/Fibronectin type III domain